MKQKTTTTLDNNTLAVVGILSNPDAGKLFKAIEETFENGELRVLFALFKQQIDSDNAKHKQTSETNSSNAKGRNKSAGKLKREKKAGADEEPKDADVSENADEEDSGDDNDGSDVNDGKPPEQNEPPQTSESKDTIAEYVAVANKQAIVGSQAVVAEGVETKEVGSVNSVNESKEEDLSFEHLESLYPKKDAASVYRQTSESEWKALSEDGKRQAIAYVQSCLNDGFATINDMFLNQFLKKKPWL